MAQVAYCVLRNSSPWERKAPLANGDEFRPLGVRKRSGSRHSTAVVPLSVSEWGRRVQAPQP
jgi:hypothetical protein